MKKLLGVFLGVMMVFGVAGKASAAWDLANMHFVAFEEADNEMPIGTVGNEVHYDLGLNAPAYIDLSIGAFTVDTHITMDYYLATSWDDVYVGIVGGGYDEYYQTADGVFSVAHGQELRPTTPGYSAYQSGTFNMWQEFTLETPDANGNIVQSKAEGSYWMNMDMAGCNPSYGTWIAGVSGAEFQVDVNLAGIGVGAENGILLDMYAGIYDEVSLVGQWNLYLDAADGSLMASYAPVPIPASVLLLGSGLLGLFGIRRRKG